MRSFLLLILLLFIFSCNNQKSQPTADKKDPSTKKDSVPVTLNKEAKKTELYTLKPATKTDFEEAANKHSVNFSMNPQEARKVNGVLVLKINDKWTPMEAFRDTLLNENDPEIREYRYLGQNQQLNHYLVAGSFYEGFETYLVDKTTGKITPTWTEPILSPDHKYLANVSLATVMEGEPTGVQIWKVSGLKNSPSIENHLELEQQDWIPFELQWESPKSIIIKIIPADKYEQLQAEPKEEDFSYLRLRIK